jgi:magnesium chelatase family protein
MLATLVTAVIDGLRGSIVQVEVDVAPGMPGCHIVGLPDAALSEARERVRGALRNSGFQYPLSRITVNLAPADRRKRGAAYDVAIAIGILVASGQVRPSGGPWALLGELSLGGSVLAVPGVLPMVSTLARAGHVRIAVPEANVVEARMVAGVEVAGLAGLDDAARLVAGPRGRRAAGAARQAPLRVSAVAPPSRDDGRAMLPPADLADVRGQPMARWALEVALAGGHDLLLLGSPGAGKTLLARTIPGLLPPLDDVEAQEVAVIRSVAGLPADASERDVRPFRAPHHTTSYAAMVGGGRDLLPGLVTQSHLGVLFLDELAEFDRGVLDALRQPLEDGTVEIARAHGHVRYPARFQLVAAMNPCRCGWHGSEDRACRCGPEEAERYVRRVSGPLLDRIDMRVSVARVPPEALLDQTPGEPSVVVAARIAAARERARRRSGVTNGRLAGAALLEACVLEPNGRRTLAQLADANGMTARGIHRALRVARTIADLEGRGSVAAPDVTAAVSLREDVAHRLAA